MVERIEQELARSSAQGIHLGSLRLHIAFRKHRMHLTLLATLVCRRNADSRAIA